jgi:type IX secretion system PorP/SprF family membrane protein
MMNRFYFIIGMILFCACTSQAQQKAMYSQYMFNGLALNPAYSATDDAINATAMSRHQWVGFAGAPKTQTFAIHSPIRESNTSVGGLIINDKIGEVLSERGAYFTVAQRIRVNETTYFAMGLNGGINVTGAAYSDKYNESLGSVNDPTFQDESNTSSSFGFGLLLFSDKYYVGFSSPQFYNHDIGTYAAHRSATAFRPHYMLQGGYLVTLTDQLKLKPNFLMKYVDGSPLQVDLNANLLVAEKVWLGASYRSLDSFEAIAQFNVSPAIAFGYSYDFVTTELARVQKGSHEIMVQFRFGIKDKNAPRCFF